VSALGGTGVQTIGYAAATSHSLDQISARISSDTSSMRSKVVVAKSYAAPLSEDIDLK
jgi:hypothetical protein